MTQPGGAATHYGVLYQALGTIDAPFTISSRGDPADPESVTLTSEPRGGGGDAIAASPQRRTVMQFKARSDHGTWSLNEIIDDALRDLYRAVPNEPDARSEYVLITEGREGAIEEAFRFFRGLSASIVPDDPLAILDDETPRRYFPSGEPVTDRRFFAEIVQRITSEAASPALYRRVWSLLSRFGIRPEEKLDDLAQRVERRLLGYVDAPEDVPGKARELYGLLLQIAAKGSQTFTLSALLRRVDLPTISLADLPATRGVAADRLATKLKRLGHDASRVVRRGTLLTDHSPMYCIAGDSGFGKTTLAGQIATELVANEIVVFVSTRKGIDAALQDAADEVWKRLLGHGRAIDWESLIQQSRRVGLAERGRWLTVCLDITAGSAEAQQLMRFEWTEWGVRLLFTADEAAGTKIRDDPAMSTCCAVQIVEELSVSETYEFLKRRGRSIAQVPHDVVTLLRRPILADVYCRVTQITDWRPANEYELFNAFWNEAAEGQDGARHRQDLGILLRLGESLLEGSEPYPWPQDVLHRMAVSDDAQQRLIQHGWLRELESTDIEFAHERFANWAVARTIHERKARGRWSTDDLAARLAEINGLARAPGDLFLGYVPMDVLWLFTTNGAPVEVIVAVIKAVGGDVDHNRGLYDNLLPSIGPALVPALHLMMREEGREWHSRHTLSQCVIRIASQAVIPDAVVVALLEDETEEIHNTGLALARTQPQIGSLDRLWRLQKQADAVSEKSTQSHWRRERALRALMAAVRKNPEWIRTAIQTTESIEELRTLAWMVSMLGDERGAVLWRNLKSVLLARFGDQGVRGALQCIDRYDDREEIDRLAGWVVTGDNFVPAEALAALAAIDGARAFAIVENEPLERVETLAAFWLPPLMLQDSARTHEAIRKRFESSEFSPASLRWHFTDERQIGPSMIAAVVKRLDDLIVDQLGAPKRDRPPVEAEHLLGVLGSVNSLDGLRTLRAQADTPFADSLVQLAAQYTPHDANTLERWFIRAIQQVLLRIGGRILSRFVLLQLSNPGDWARSDIRSAATSPSPEALQQLIALAAKTPGDDRERVQAMEALHTIAGLGERETVVRVLETNEHLWIDEELLQLLDEAPEIDDVQLSRLLSRDAAKPAERVRRFHLLSLSDRSDAVERIIEEVMAETNDDVKTAAFHAIQQLASSATPVDAALRIGFSQEPEAVAAILCAIDTDQAIDVLESQLEKLDGTRISGDLAAIAAWLVTTKKRLGLAPLVWQFVESPRRRLRVSTTRLYDAAGYLDAPVVLDFLHQEAFAGQADDRLGAVRGLSHHRSEAAFDAALAALESSGANRGSYGDLLIEIDPSRGVEALCRRLIVEREHLVRAYICRALRRAQNDAVSQRVHGMLVSSDVYERAAGCQAAGWLDFRDASLPSLALRDADAMVRAFAVGAVEMHQHNTRVAALLSELGRAGGSDAWAIVQAILDSANPLLFTLEDDPLYLGRALSGKPRAMIVYAQHRIEKQMKEWSRKSDDVFEPYYR